jgi:phage tail-like protein
MDANGTRYQLLLGADDWFRCVDEEGHPLSRTDREGSGVAWDDERSEVTLRPHPHRFGTTAAELPPALGDRRGAGRDRFGNWYWIDPARRGILVRSSGDDRVSTFWSPEAAAGERLRDRGGFGDRERAGPRALELAGLAVTEDHVLAAGVVAPGPGLIVFDLQSGGPAVELAWPGDVPFEPFDLAPRTGGGVYVLDRANRRLWELDRSFAVVSRAEEGAGEEPPRPLFRAVREAGDAAEEPARTPIRLDDGAPIEGDRARTRADPIAVDAMPGCEALVLDRRSRRGGARLIRFARGAVRGESLPIESDEQLEAHDLAFVPARDRPGRAYLVAGSGNQAFAVDLVREEGALRARLAPRFFPLRRFGGKALVAAGGEAYYDFGEAWLRLVEQRRTRYEPAAALETHALDGREPGCVWHRLLLDACLPPDAAVHVWTRAADDEAGLALATWSPEPDLRPRRGGSELPFRARGPSPYETLELLVQRSRGRFLQVKLQLRGDGRSSPRIRALRAYYPRFSYLEEYLPAVYREDETSASFLDRFLANFEGIYTGIEDRIAGAQALLDPRTAPPDALEWLAGWFDVALDPAWSERRRRLFIANATRFFRYRGTVRGVELALRLALDGASGEDEDLFSFRAPRPHERTAQIVERYRTRRTPGLLDDAAARRERSEVRTSQWRPSDGADDLHARYREFVLRTLGRVHAALRYTLTPQPASFAADWRRFSEAVLGFVPSATAADAPAWQAFLARRHRRVADLNRAYGTSVGSFAAVPLPSTLPTDPSRLRDWFQFESIVLGTRRTAHRFTVLVPAPADPEPERAAAEAARLTRLAERVVALEKPAHTVFDVRFSWSAFRLGEARLGSDTVAERGSRAAALLATTVLGRARIGESFLAGNRARHLVERAPVRREPPYTTPPDRRDAP